MKTNELRIGNYVNIEGDVVKVKEIYEKSIHYTYGEYESYATEDFIQPIELTEEILVKIGFEKDGNNYSLICGDIEVGYYIDKFKQVLCISVSREKRFYKNELRSYDVKYLHQLQNAYYLLTNEELEVELWFT